MPSTSRPEPIVLVAMPYAEVQRPSIALGLLRSALTAAGIGSRVCYANLRFAERIGLDLYRSIAATATDHLLGEWTFSGALFGDFRDDAGYLERTLGLGCRGISADPEECRQVFRAVRREAGAYLDELADEVLAGGPRVVGCSSTFQQHCASLALLQRIRERSPETVTVIGGANCEGEMGAATLEAFPQVDLAVSGEADELFPELCRQLLEAGRAFDPALLPRGVLARGREGAPPRATVRALDALPLPDYRPYFEALGASPLSPHVHPGLPAESSRGCWWGEKSHCSFCGLNGSGMGYRSKSAETVRRELARLAERHALRRFELVDNILDMGHLRTLLPALAEVDEPYSLFYETKANLRREHLRSLAAAGVRWIQPGIESLHDSVLALIAKGNGAAMNLQLLRWAREHGIRLSWNLLCGFPGERDEWYLEMADWLPAVFHLQPPAGIFRVRYDRFSPYHLRPEDHGLELIPTWAYAHVYPFERPLLDRLAYYFEDAGTPSVDHRGRHRQPGHRAVQGLIASWQRAWSDGPPPSLRLVDEGDRLRLIDDRPGARVARWTLDGLAAALYRACDRARDPDALWAQLERDHPGAPRERFEADVDALCRARLLLRLHGKLVALAVEGPHPPLPTDADFPGGHTTAAPIPVATAVTAPGG